MPASRKIFILSATALVCHFVALAVHATIASNIIEFVLVLLAAAACFEAAGRAAGYARRFWRLMAVAFGVYALGQGMAAYYDSVMHASFEQWWPSDILFLFHVAPMALALFLGDDSAESRVYQWQRWLDSLQIGIVSLSAYFFFLPHSRASIDALYVKVTAGRGLLIAGAFVLRALLTNSKLVKSLFGRVATFLVILSSARSLTTTSKSGGTCPLERGTNCSGPFPGYYWCGWRQVGRLRPRPNPCPRRERRSHCCWRNSRTLLFRCWC